jgi:hypothetical protein
MAYNIVIKGVVLKDLNISTEKIVGINFYS